MQASFEATLGYLEIVIFDTGRPTYYCHALHSIVELPAGSTKDLNHPLLFDDYGKDKFLS